MKGLTLSAMPPGGREAATSSLWTGIHLPVQAIVLAVLALSGGDVSD